MIIELTEKMKRMRFIYPKGSTIARVAYGEDGKMELVIETPRKVETDIDKPPIAIQN